MLAQLERLDSLHPFVWERLAQVAGCTPAELRSDVMLAGQRACAFFQFRTLDECNKLPWTLCRGDQGYH